MTTILRPPFGPESFQAQFKVSRETLQDLKVYEELLKRWQPIKNLIAPKTLDEIWLRHFADSAQLWRFARYPSAWIDMGSGAGFPGLIIAILCKGDSSVSISLIESNARKCAFLRDVIRQLELAHQVKVFQSRIEDVTLAQCVPASRGAAVSDCEVVFTARALAPLSDLIAHALVMLGNAQGGRAAPDAAVDAGRVRGLFLKGRGVDAEVDAVHRDRAGALGEVVLHQSVTDPDARIVDIKLPVAGDIGRPDDPRPARTSGPCD